MTEEITKSVEEALNTLAHSTSKRGMLLSDTAQDVLDNSLTRLDEIFDHSQHRVAQVMDCCAQAKATIEVKRAAARQALTELVQAQQALEVFARDAQRFMGELLVHTDRMPT